MKRLSYTKKYYYFLNHEGKLIIIFLAMGNKLGLTLSFLAYT